MRSFEAKAFATATSRLGESGDRSPALQSWRNNGQQSNEETKFLLSALDISAFTCWLRSFVSLLFKQRPSLRRQVAWEKAVTSHRSPNGLIF
jgi:hypothetical protein